MKTIEQSNATGDTPHLLLKKTLAGFGLMVMGAGLALGGNAVSGQAEVREDLSSAANSTPIPNHAFIDDPYKRAGAADEYRKSTGGYDSFTDIQELSDYPWFITSDEVVQISLDLQTELPGSEPGVVNSLHEASRAAERSEVSARNGAIVLSVGAVAAGAAGVLRQRQK